MPCFSNSAWYAAGSVLYSVYRLSLPLNSSSFTIVMQSATGQTSSQMLQPMHASYTTSYVPSGVTSKHSSGHCSQHWVHLMHVSKFTRGRRVRVLHFLYTGLRVPTVMASTMMPSRICVQPGFTYSS